jgi:hypothetical protein
VSRVFLVTGESCLQESSGVGRLKPVLARKKTKLTYRFNRGRQGIQCTGWHKKKTFKWVLLETSAFTVLAFSIPALEY